MMRPFVHPSDRFKTWSNGEGGGWSVRSGTPATVSRHGPMAKETYEASVRARQRPSQDMIQWRRRRMKRPFGHASDRLKTGANEERGGWNVGSGTPATVLIQDPMAKVAGEASVRARQRPSQDMIQWRRRRMKRPFGHASDRLKTWSNGEGDVWSVRSGTPATVSRHDPIAKETYEASVRARQRPSQYMIQWRRRRMKRPFGHASDRLKTWSNGEGDVWSVRSGTPATVSRQVTMAKLADEASVRARQRPSQDMIQRRRRRMKRPFGHASDRLKTWSNDEGGRWSVRSSTPATVSRHDPMAMDTYEASVRARQRPSQDMIQWRRRRMKRPFGWASDRFKTWSNGEGGGWSVRSGAPATVSRHDTMAKEADEASVRARQRPLGHASDRLKTVSIGEGGWWSVRSDTPATGAIQDTMAKVADEASVCAPQRPSQYMNQWRM